MSRARAAYEAQVGALLSNVWRREGEFLLVDPVELNTPLTAVLEEEAGTLRMDPEWLPSDLSALAAAPREELLGLICALMEERDNIRQRTQQVTKDYLFGGGPEPLAVLERLFLLASAGHEGCVWNMRRCEVAALFGHSKQNWRHIEERLIEDLVTRFSRVEFVNSGGKSVAARAKYAHDKKGNVSRKNGRRRGDEMPPLPAAEHAHEPLSARAKKHAEMMRAEAERKRMAALCGCDPADIDLAKITPHD